MRSTVTPRTSPLESLMAKKAEAAGDTTMPPRSFPVGASCLRSSGFVMARVYHAGLDTATRLLMRPVVLVGESHQGGPLDDNKAVLGALVAGIAGGVELVVAGNEFAEILRLDRLFQSDDFLGDDGVEHVLERQVFEHRHDVLHVAHDFLDL